MLDKNPMSSPTLTRLVAARFPSLKRVALRVSMLAALNLNTTGTGHDA